MSYISLGTITLGANIGQVVFGSIPTTVSGVTLRDLVAVLAGSVPVGGAAVDVRLNGDSTSGNYLKVGLTGSEFGGVGGFRGTGPLDGVLANTPGLSTWEVFDYSISGRHKTITLSSNSNANHHTTSIKAAIWTNTAPVTSVTVSVSGATFASGTVVSLYGIAG